jgi:hypothetical protein
MLDPLASRDVGGTDLLVILADITTLNVDATVNAELHAQALNAFA